MADSQTGEASRPEPKKRRPPVEFENPSIHNPLVDSLCVGGLSILVIAGFLVYLWLNPEMISQLKPDEPGSVQVEQQQDSVRKGIVKLGDRVASLNQDTNLALADQSGINSLLLMFWLTVLLNNPHFMSSYRLLYRSREQVLRYRWSSMYMPLLLLGAAGFCLFGQMQGMTPKSPDIDGVVTNVRSDVIEISIGADDGLRKDHELGVFHGKSYLGRLKIRETRPNSAVGEIVPTRFSISEILLQVLGAVAALYLAWHYNGQAWGMTASFLYMAGIRVTQYERRCIRSAYWSLTAFHVVWSLSLFLRGHETLEQIKDAVFVLSLLMIPVGIHGFRCAARRTKKRIPLPALLPWVAIYFWYVLVYIHDYALIFLQLSHSLQYLCFTSRVELNLASRKTSRFDVRLLGVPLSVCLLYLALLGSGWLVFELARFVPMTTPQEKVLQAGLGLLAVIVNIHHYFVDGAIWKISNPKVRQDLFAHLKSV